MLCATVNTVRAATVRHRRQTPSGGTTVWCRWWGSCTSPAMGNENMRRHDGKAGGPGIERYTIGVPKVYTIYTVSEVGMPSVEGT